MIFYSPIFGPYIYINDFYIYIVLASCALLSLAWGAWHDAKTFNVPLKVWIPMLIPLVWSTLYWYRIFYDAFRLLSGIPILIFIIVCGYLTIQKHIHTTDFLGLTFCSIILTPLFNFNAVYGTEFSPYLMLAIAIIFMLPTRLYIWHIKEKRQTKLFSGEIPFLVPLLCAFVITILLYFHIP
jgi:hypothetical protein